MIDQFKNIRNFENYGEILYEVTNVNLGKDTLTGIGVILTFIIGVFNLIYSISNNKKTSYINTVTAERIKWITKVREYIAEFYTDIDYYARSDDDMIEKVNRTNLLRMKIKLYLNPEENQDIIVLIDELNDLLKYARIGTSRILLNSIQRERTRQILYHELNQLVLKTQTMLKAEWEKVKKESENGNLKYLNDWKSIKEISKFKDILKWRGLEKISKLNILHKILIIIILMFIFVIIAIA